MLDPCVFFVVCWYSILFFIACRQAKMNTNQQTSRNKRFLAIKHDVEDYGEDEVISIASKMFGHFLRLILKFQTGDEAYKKIGRMSVSELSSECMSSLSNTEIGQLQKLSFFKGLI